MTGELQGRRALVTGASRGLGRASAQALAARGARVVISSRNGDDLRAAATQIAGETGTDVIPIACDVTDPEAITRLYTGVDAKLGGLDILVCNAGGPPAGRFDAFEDADWQNAFELTLLSSVRLIRHALPRLRTAGGGSIVCITSSSVRQPIPGLIISNVMRAGVASLVKSLSRELAADSIRINNVVPGRLDTDRVRELDAIRAGGGDPAEVRRAAEQRIPLGRYGNPLELGNAVAFLCSDQASYITGAALPVDGGMIEALP